MPAWAPFRIGPVFPRQTNPKLKSRLTMAARNGEGITEQEMDSILADLRELGVIDDEGNPIER